MLGSAGGIIAASNRFPVELETFCSVSDIHPLPRVAYNQAASLTSPERASSTVDQLKCYLGVRIPLHHSNVFQLRILLMVLNSVSNTNDAGITRGHNAIPGLNEVRDQAI